jgi:hypothetical protein
LIPSHCKVVGRLALGGPLTRGSIEEAARGKRAYKLTDYYCATDGKGWAVLRVMKRPGASLLLPVVGVEVLALPHETAYLEDPSLDTTNPTAMLQAAERWAPKSRCLVVQGEFHHLSFIIRDGEEVRVRAFDVVPPHQSKVAVLARRALATTPLPVLLEEATADLADLARAVPPGRRLLFPCRASGLRLDGEVEYLDEQPRIERGEDLVLVGCRLSERIFRERYGFPAPEVVSMCPLDLAAARGDGGTWTLVKCCNEKGPFGFHDRIVAVPWSATRGDVAAALEEIVERDKSERARREG